MVDRFKPAVLHDKLLGAWLGRAAGCILGIPCEGMSKPDIRNAATGMGMRYPLDDYWALDPKFRDPKSGHYGITPRREFLKGNLHYAGTDDDLTYTLLGLLILEDYGPDFTTADVGGAWLKYLPMACTAEAVALANLRAGVGADECGAKNNPFVDWIGADIRSDPWAYAAPGWPEKAAELAHRDAWISHRATGIHGEMFFSAAISAAFAVGDPVEALKIGLSEIPRDCRTAQTVKETLDWCARDGDWDKTTARILQEYQGMSGAHTLNNAALTVAGLVYGRRDFGRTIALTVMGGVDTDCTGATAGSLLGAVLGAKRLPKKWTARLGRRAESYIIGRRWWRHADIARRFAAIANRILRSARWEQAHSSAVSPKCAN
jgi:ADP-ribosylglycohydrolase